VAMRPTAETSQGKQMIRYVKEINADEPLQWAASGGKLKTAELSQCDTRRTKSTKWMATEIACTVRNSVLCGYITSWVCVW
jgi:hypothetical protein